MCDTLTSEGYEKGRGGEEMNKAQEKVLYERYIKAKATLPACPDSIGAWVGCKIVRYEYSTEAEARVASQHAKLDAEYKSCLGYDFGYYSGGEIIPTKAGTFEVVFP
jgi:hypothetical protein